MKKYDIEEINKNGKFAVILKCLLQKKHIKQWELAEDVGLSNATITNYVKGKSSPSQKTIEKIAKALDVSPQAFYDDINLYTPYLNINEKNFVERFRFLFDKSGISQEQFSKEIGVSRQTVNYYYNGRMMPTRPILEEICKYFNVQNDYFFKNDEKIVKTMKIIVNEMPKTQIECLFREYQGCKFGECKLKDGKCPYLITLGEANTGVYLTSDMNISTVCDFVHHQMSIIGENA